MEKVFCIACGSICDMPSKYCTNRTTNLNKMMLIPEELFATTNPNLRYIEILTELLESINLQLPFMDSNAENKILCEQCTILVEQYHRFRIEITVIEKILTEQLIENYKTQSDSLKLSSNNNISLLQLNNATTTKNYTKDMNDLYRCRICPTFATLKPNRIISHIKCHQFCKESFPFNRDTTVNVLADDTNEIFDEQLVKAKKEVFKDQQLSSNKIEVAVGKNNNFHIKLGETSALLNYKQDTIKVTKFSCHHCNFSTQKNSEICKHFKMEHSDKIGGSSYDFYNIETFFVCPNCGEKLYNPYGKCDHSTVIGKIDPLICENCNDLFYSKELLNQHYAIKHMQCFKCKKEFRKIATLKYHLLACVHEKHKCEICGHLCVNKSSRIKHMQVHTGDKPYKCDLCTKKYTSAFHLRQHRNGAHTNEMLYTCEICQAKFNNIFRLTYHRRMHLDELPIPCKYKDCKMRFRHFSLRSSHVRIAHKAEFYQCEFCGRKFERNKSLKDHLQVHSGIPSYPCQLCPSRFSRSHILKKHVVKCHPKSLEVPPV